MRRAELEVEEPRLPRKPKVPKRFELGAGEAEFHSTAKGLYKQTYLEALDLAVTSITDRFDQPGFRTYSILSSYFSKLAVEKTELGVRFACDFYGQDLSKQDLESQLKVLRTIYSEKVEKEEQPSIKVLKQVFQSLSPPQRSLVEMVCRIFQLLLLMPATNSERSFSALRRIKTYLRSTMSQASMNHLR